MLKSLRKEVWYTLCIAMMMAIALYPQTSEAKSLETKAKSAIIVDADTGKVLYEKDADTALPPASMTKMMTEYLVLEAIDNGDIDWDTKTEISDYAYKLSGNDDFSGVGLRKDVEYTVEDLYKAMAINSDNATTVVLAELLADSEGEFVKMMNDKAEELGLSDYKFVNSTGLDNDTLDGDHPKGTEADDTNLMSAKTAAQLGYHLVTDYPEVLDISSEPKDKFDDQEILNWNWMLDHDATFYEPFYYEGVDGLKTGNTDQAGYTFTSTAEKDDRRLITVVMKTESEEERFEETAKLLDYGFDEFEEKELFEAGYTFDGEDVPVTKGKEKQVPVQLEESVEAPIKKGDEDKYSLEFDIDKDVVDEEGNLKAPVEKGEKIGTAQLAFDEDEDFGYILDDDKTVSAEVVAAEDVDKKNWFSLMLGGIGSFFSNLYHKFMDLF
ncbi:MAG TPA: serine hydrolase [Pseudogracilibacillus sp.]|nr:serine hydrolase [Pseudogracilibacillus sp.]